LIRPFTRATRAPASKTTLARSMITRNTALQGGRALSVTALRVPVLGLSLPHRNNDQCGHQECSIRRSWCLPERALADNATLGLHPVRWTKVGC
jgi:hypothetical protein